MQDLLFTLFYILKDGTDHIFHGDSNAVLSKLHAVDYTEHAVICKCGSIPVYTDDLLTLVCLSCGGRLP